MGGFLGLSCLTFLIRASKKKTLLLVPTRIFNPGVCRSRKAIWPVFVNGSAMSLARVNLNSRDWVVAFLLMYKVTSRCWTRQIGDICDLNESNGP